MSNESTLSPVSLEELVEKRNQALIAIDELDAARKAIDQEIVARLTEQNLKATQVGNYTVTRVTTTKFKVTLEEAKQYGAVKTREAVDMTKVKQLAKAGVKFLTETFSYPLIKEIETQ